MRTKRKIAVLILFLFAAATVRAITVEEIPSPRPTGWSVDLTGWISPATLIEINRVGDAVRSKTGAEMAVVVVGSVNGEDSHDFATRLLNAWHVGDRTRNDGVLVLAALDDHKAEIVLGSGLDNEQSRQTSREIMQSAMLPRFRSGDPAAAILEGARSCAQRILGVQIAQSAETAPQPLLAPAPESVPQPYVPQRIAVLPPPRSTAGGIPGLVWLLAPVFLGGGFLLVRYRPRRCRTCGMKMVHLDEAADDEHLTAAERIEEEVGSVDYDVWLCEGCGASTKLRFGGMFTSYSSCPKCRAKTRLSTKETLRSATYESEGLVRVEETCANCSYRSASTYTIPRLVQTATRSYDTSSSSSSFSSSSLSSSSSPSSSSDSGFSGGHSDGGGASGQW